MVSSMIVERNSSWFRPPDDETLRAVVNATRRHEMRSFWEQTGVLGPIYRLVGEGVNDGDIAEELDLTEAKVRGCIAWIVRLLELRNREELVLCASTAA
jgi:DNA-binding NarL/FixJ family response regulator